MNIAVRTQRVLPNIILFLVCIFAYKAWFFDVNSILTDGDWDYISEIKSYGFFDLPNPYNINDEGSFNFGLPFYPIMLLWGALSNFLTFAQIERILYLWPAALLSIYSPYLLCRILNIGKWFSLLCALIFSFNTYIVSTKTGHLTLAVAYPLAILAIALLIKAINSNLNRRYILLCGLFTGICGWYEPRAQLICFGLCVIILIYLPTYNHKIRPLDRIKQFFLIICISSLINAYWLLPTIFQSPTSSEFVFTRQLFGKSFQDLQHALTAVHPYWSGENFIRFELQNVPIVSWIQFLLLINIIFKFRNDHIVRSFTIIYICGVLLAKQQSEPIGVIYEFLYNHIPTFSLFRESTKFYFIVAISMSVIFARGTELYWAKRSFIINKLFLYIIITISTICIALPIHALYSGRITDLNHGQQPPNQLIELRKWLIDNAYKRKVFWIPAKSRWISLPEKNYPYGSYRESYQKISKSILNQRESTLYQVIASKDQFLKYLNDNDYDMVAMAWASEDMDTTSFIEDYGQYAQFKSVLSGYKFETLYNDSISVVYQIPKSSISNVSYFGDSLYPISRNIFLINPDNTKENCIINIPAIFSKPDWYLIKIPSLFNFDKIQISKILRNNDGDIKVKICTSNLSNYKTYLIIYMPVIYSVIGLVLSIMTVCYLLVMLIKLIRENK